MEACTIQTCRQCVCMVDVCVSKCACAFVFVHLLISGCFVCLTCLFTFCYNSKLRNRWKREAKMDFVLCISILYSTNWVFVCTYIDWHSYCIERFAVDVCWRQINIAKLPNQLNLTATTTRRAKKNIIEIEMAILFEFYFSFFSGVYEIESFNATKWCKIF